MKRKGFTLIELLAVIVILAVIAIIAVPMVMGVIESTRKSALKESANALVEEAGYYYMQYGVEDNVRFDIEDNEINKINGNTLLFKGHVKDATVLINTKGEVALCINDGDYSVYKNYSDSKLIEVDNKNCNIPTGQAVVFLENESTIREYTNEELTQLIINLQEQIQVSATTISNLQQEVTVLKNSTDGNPTGTVISYMGNNVPIGYLPCDGTVYNIADYPVLAEQIKTEFGSYNNFGGDGTTTFAVPDLRGEFLRGTGTAKRNTGSGAGVGVHQDATRMPSIAPTYNAANSGRLNIYLDTTDEVNIASYRDRIYETTAIGAFIIKTDINFSSTTSTKVYSYASRPTNTSVLYCIKY